MLNQPNLIIQNKQIELITPHKDFVRFGFDTGLYYLIKENEFQYCVTKVKPNENHLLSKYGGTTNSYIWLNKTRFKTV